MTFSLYMYKSVVSGWKWRNCNEMRLNYDKILMSIECRWVPAWIIELYFLKHFRLRVLKSAKLQNHFLKIVVQYMQSLHGAAHVGKILHSDHKQDNFSKFWFSKQMIQLWHANNRWFSIDPCTFLLSGIVFSIIPRLQ